MGKMGVSWKLGSVAVKTSLVTFTLRENEYIIIID
jgi:hypothetical protein